MSAPMDSDQSKSAEVFAHATAILSIKMANLMAAGAELAEVVAYHEGRIANHALARWQAAVADARGEDASDEQRPISGPEIYRPGSHEAAAKAALRETGESDG